MTSYEYPCIAFEYVLFTVSLVVFVLKDIAPARVVVITRQEPAS